MTSNNVYRLLALPFIGVLLLTACTTDTVNTGGSSGTEISEVTGTATDSGGKPLTGAIVRLRPMSYLVNSGNDTSYLSAHSIKDTVTGTDGSFTITGLKIDSYLLEVVYADTLGCVAELHIDSQGTGVSLPVIITKPMSEITGHIEVEFTNDITVTVNVYGLDRSVPVAATGDFVLKVPGGKHRIHIGAYLDTTEAAREYYGFDMPPLDVPPGEQRYAGSLTFRPPPSEPCTSGACDSSVVRSLLEAIGNGVAAWPDSITETANGRIVALNLRGYDLSEGTGYEVHRLAALQLLDLGNTRLHHMVPFIEKLTLLEIIRLDDNAIDYFVAGTGNMTNLRELDLHDNYLSALHPSLLGCERLEYLDVADNRLCSVDSVMSTWLDTFDPDWQATQWCRQKAVYHQ